MASTLAIPVRPAGSAERYFQWSLYLLLVTGFAALAGTGKLDFLSLAVVTPALVLRAYHLLKGKGFTIAERWTNYLTLLYLAVYALDYFMLSQGFVSATVHLVLFIMVVKIFSVHRDRDLVYLAVLSFLMVLAAAVLTVDTLFLLTFGLFLLMAMSTFISMEVRRSERSAQAVGVAMQQERRFNRSLSGVAVLLSLATLAGATVLFFILPRMSTGGGYLRNLGFQSSFVTGFSSEVQLGGIGQIQQSDSVVMHVQVLRGKLPPDIKWRGVALVNFDGRRWWNTVPETALSRPLNNAALDLSQVRVGAGPLFSTVATSRSSTLAYRIIMEPIGSYIFFVAPMPVRISGPYDQIVVTQQGSLYFNSDTGKTIGVYYAEADTRDPEPWIQNSNSRDYPPGLELMYRQLPSRLDPRIPSLAQQITASSASNYARARAIETYLRKNFGYTLQLPGRENDPIANFLFERKRGHCEYFASSMAVMLRTLGIPARVVNGFRGGAFNDLNNSYIVRSKDAHSWV
ncbi:MAG TPA: DUF3488 and transglutaminase-like domain-containing protein, partial [Candidatus Angelobacter sp.]|nr:DUF3488 and transglutaminase-like domain-containing protein [Candidatus Angelobacter sp.]